MKSILFLLIIIPSFITIAFAQDDLASYERAKTLIGYGNFNDAMELLQPYLDERNYGTLSRYASYHYAYAAYQQSQYNLVHATLEPLLESKTWNLSDEARYLIALTHFQEGNNLEALREIQTIKDPELIRESEKATFNFLRQASVSFLVSNLSEFKNNPGFVMALKEQMENKTILSSDEKAIYYELKSLKLDENKLDKNRRNNGELDIAIILPFNQTGNSGVDRLDPNNFVFELYQGLKYAAKELKNNGIKLNVKTYDSGRDVAKTKRILADPFVGAADVIIGPIYPEESELVAYFAEINKIPYINPLSNVDENFESMEYAYLFRPSVASISQGIMDYLKANLNGKKIGIGYSSATRDELLSKKTADLAVKNGFQVVKNVRISEKDIRGFLGEAGITRYDNTNVDALIIFSDDPNIAAPTFGLLESINVSIPILVMDSWLYFNFANYEMFQNPNIHFVGNNPIQFNNENVKEFREGFFEETLMYPSINAHLGYDLVHWLSENLNKSTGFDLNKNLNERGFQQGKITYGMNFKNSRNNTYVPILKLDNGVLEIK